MADPADAGSVPAGPPSPLVASPVVLLVLLGRVAREQLDHELAGAGLSLRHLGALGHLRRTPGLSYSELGRRAGVTAQSMQATVAQLEAGGLVARTSRPGRGRTADLQVTAAGVSALQAAERAVGVVEERLLADVPAGERAALIAALWGMARSTAVDASPRRVERG